MRPIGKTDWPYWFIMLRGDLGLSQRDMAKRLGVSQQAVSQIEHGQVEPGGEVVVGMFRLVREASEELKGKFRKQFCNF